MSSKQIVLDFYKSDALISSDIVRNFIHPDIVVEWNNTEGVTQLDYNAIIDLTDELNKAYVRSKIRISHIVSENNTISVRYSHFVKTIENPREEMLLAHFMVIWELKDDKLYRGFQISQKP